MTPRQAQILALVAEGLGDKEIARRLGVSTNTVRTHLQRYYRDHSIRNRAEAAAIWAAQRPTGSTAAPPAQPPSAPAAVPPLARRAVVALPALIVPVVLMATTLLATYAPAKSLLGRYANGHGPILAISSATPRPPRPGTEASADPATASPNVGRSPAATPIPAPTPSPLAGTGGPSPDLPHATPPAVPAASPPPPPAPKITAAPALAEQGLITANRAGAGKLPLTWDGCLAGLAASSAEHAAAAGYAPLVATPANGSCAGAVQIATWLSAVDDAKANSLLMGNAQQKAIILGPYQRMGAAWATANGISYLVIVIA